MTKFKTVDEYISSAPPETRGRLKDLRAVIKEAAPEAEEVISYGMPGYKLNGPLVYFAFFKNHVSLFPTSSKVDVIGIEKFRTGKGTLSFPNDKPLPLTLIKKAVEYRVKENLKK